MDMKSSEAEKYAMKLKWPCPQPKENHSGSPSYIDCDLTLPGCSRDWLCLFFPGGLCEERCPQPQPYRTWDPISEIACLAQYLRPGTSFPVCQPEAVSNRVEEKHESVTPAAVGLTQCLFIYFLMFPSACLALQSYLGLQEYNADTWRVEDMLTYAGQHGDS